MYCEHFGLKIAPFNNTPDPRFFFNTPDHEEALASLLYAVELRKGFVLVTGEVGAGKTLLSRLLLNRLGSNVRTAVITNTRLTGTELLQAICREFEIDTEDATTSAELTHRLEEFLLEQYARDRLAVVIVDEAQNLPVEALEELRMLGNLEADDAKLLQILLLGQPELQEAFRHPSLRQTYQRVFRTFHLHALDHSLTTGYVAHRLRVGGLPSDKRIFARDAVDSVYRYAEGIPRLINQICDNALLAAYSAGREIVTAAMIDEVVTQMLSLNVRSEQAKPQGDFARQMLGASPPAQTPAAPQEPIKVPIAAPNEGIPSDELARIDSKLRSFEIALADVRGESEQDKSISRDNSEIVRHLSDRLQALERGIHQVREQQAEIRQHQEAIGATKERSDAELRDLQKFRKETLDSLDEAAKNARDSETQIREFLRSAEARAAKLEERAGAAVTAADKAQLAVERRTRELAGEFEQLTTTTTSRVDAAVGESRAEADAVRELRQEVAALQEHVIEAQRASESRVGQAIAEASELSKSLETRAREFITAAKSQTGDLQDQLKTMLDELHEKSDASQARMIELLAQQRSEMEAAQVSLDECVRSAFARSNIMDRESKRLVDELKEQAKSVLDTVHGVRDRTVARAEEVTEKADSLVAEMTEKLELANQRMQGLVHEAERRVGSACAEFQDVQKRMVEDSTATREQAEKANAETRTLLTETRESCEKLLAELSEHVAEQTKLAEAAWRESAERGAKSIGEITKRLDAAKAAADESHAQLESVIAQTEDQINAARRSLDSSMSSHREQVDSMAEQSAAMRADFEARFQEARDALDAIMKKHRSEIGSRVSEMVRETDAAVSDVESRAQTHANALDTRFEQHKQAVDSRVEEMIRDTDAAAEDAITRAQAHADSLNAKFSEHEGAVDAKLNVHEKSIEHRVGEMQSRTTAQLGDAERQAAERLERLKAQLAETSTNADRIYQDLKNAVETVEQHAELCQQQFRESSTSLRGELDALMEKQNKIVSNSKAEIDRLTQQVDGTTGRFQHEMRQLNEMARSRITSIGKELADVLAKAMARADDVRKGAEQSSAEITKRVDATRGEAEKSVKTAEDAIRRVRMQSKSSLEEVRQCLAQMTERADIVRRELGNVGDEIRHASKETVDHLAKTGDRVTSQIESLRDAAMDDADKNYKRLNSVRLQVEQGAEQMRQNAAKLLDQVQSGAAALRRHADEMLVQAQSGAENLNESAASMMLQAQTSSERFREQAESLLHNAEKMSQGIRDEVQSLRNQLAEETDRIRRQVNEARHEIVQSRQETSKIVNDAAENQRRAESRASDLIKRAENVQSQAETLLSMPRELIDEAKRQAGALSEMSKKVSTVVRQLNEAGSSAERNKNELVRAESDADEKIRLLKAHTERVGQLLGIIRQLYGSMDARVERLRGRLSQFDELFRTVPRELDGLRTVLDTEIARGGYAPPSRSMDMRMSPADSGRQAPSGTRGQTPSGRHEPSAAEPQGQPSGGRRRVPNSGGAYDRERKDLPDLLNDGSPGDSGVAVAATPQASRAKTAPRSAVEPATPDVYADPNAPGKRQASPQGAVPAQLQAGSLGEIVQRNEKLQKWLKDMLGEDAVSRRGGSGDAK